MTPFAAKVSRDVNRFMRSKLMPEQKSDLTHLTQGICEYLSQLYKGVYNSNDNKLICVQAPLPSNEIVPIYVMFDLTAQHNPDIEYDYWRQLKLLEEKIKKYNNILNGFVVLLTNHKELWEVPEDYFEEDDIYTLKGTAYRHTTLYPMTTHVRNEEVIECPPCQMVWLPTKYQSYRICIATFDEYFQEDGYECEIEKVENPSTYEPNEQDNLAEYPRQRDEEANGELTIEQKFRLMLKTERFVKPTHNLKTWENEILNDYSRLMMSPAVRRLKDKTQVFSLESSDFARVRLTHSLEVSHVARLICKGIENGLQDRMDDIKEFNIPEILAVAGLVHDIGNPPFGHSGEKTIQTFFSSNNNMMSQRVQVKFDEELEDDQKADFYHYDGNVQGLRILRHLGLTDDSNSFNLNKVVLSTMIKYPYSSIDGNDKKSKDHRRTKFGFFCSEKEDYLNICASLHLAEGQRHPLTYILEAADDIVYIGDDIEDGWKLEYISMDAICKALNDFTQEEFNDIWGEPKAELLARLGDECCPVNQAHAIQTMRIGIQRYMLDKCVNIFVRKFDDIVSNNLPEDKQELLNFDNTSMKINKMWKKLVVHCYNRIHRTQLIGEKSIRGLLKIFTDTIFDFDLVHRNEIKIDEQKNGNKRKVVTVDYSTKAGMIYEIISDNYRFEHSPIGQEVPQDAYSKFLLVTDFVAGMTDTYAYSLYNELKN